MENLSEAFLTLGVILILGLATDAIGRRTPLPRVTLLLILGFLIGPSGLKLLPEFSKMWFPFITDAALLMIGFLLGEKLSLSLLGSNSRAILWISISEVFITAAVVLVGLLLIGVSIDITLLLAAIATATAPAATVDVVREIRAAGHFTRTLLGIVAIDDAWGLILFSFLLAIVHTLTGQGSGTDLLLNAIWDLGGAIIIGILLGLPMSYLTGRIRPGEPTLAEALGLVFLCGGFAIWFEVSFILASMVLGGVVANLARHHKRPFHAIENIEGPFLILFFVLAGASLHLESLLHIGLIGMFYVIFRVVGRILGAWTGGHFSHADSQTKRWMGIALMPQAGVAMGMALIAKENFPNIGETIVTIVIGATVIFELIGPVLTRKALVSVGEVPSNKKIKKNRY
jgi:Kef-type K+ transport system membrane component KefB